MGVFGTNMADFQLGLAMDDKAGGYLETDEEIAQDDDPLADIKAAYRALAMKYHPDKGGDSDTFKIIARAYEVLSDDDMRQRYDRFGEEGSGGGARPPAPPAPPGASSTRVTVAVTKFRAPCCWCGSRGHRPAQCPEWRCWTCRSPHHMKAECPERGCWTCGSYDHMQVQCPERNGGWLPR